MSKTLKIVLIATGVMLVAASLLVGGFLIGRSLLWRNFSPMARTNWGFGHGPGMMGQYYNENYQGEFGPGMMWNEDYEGSYGRGHGPGMMWQYSDEDYQGDFGPGMMWNEDYEGNYGRGHGPGMMRQYYDEDYQGDFGPGMMWDEDYQGSYGPGHGRGMMGQYYEGNEDLPVLSIEAVEETLTDYLQSFENENLAIKEIMIFSNHAYAQIVEEDTEIGAFEVLVDPVSLDIYPEHGPNMMWNLKYGMHPSGSYDEPMDISPEEAVTLAQEYMDIYTGGLEADEHADAFYGYYTLHTLKDGEITGMLSVNGYTGDVFPHNWHGTFVEMTHADEHAE